MVDYVFEPPVLVAVPVVGRADQFPVRRMVTGGADTPYPTATENLHHEMELVVAIGTGGTNIAPAEALGHVFGYAAGLDLTRRDLQDEAKAMRRPWDMSKGFDASAPIGDIATVASIGHPSAGRIALTVNGQVRQQGDLADQIWPVPDVIAYLSRLVALAPGDLIFTGTPDGVGALVRGDVLAGEIAGVGSVHTRII